MEEEKNNQEPQDELSLCQKERDEYLNGWKRAKADLINARKEWEEQLKNLADFARADFIKEFLPLLDALGVAQKIEGWEEINKLAADILKRNNVEKIGNVGESFDPRYYEAVAEGEGNPDEVIEVLQEGYKINSRVIRPAKVKIGK